MALTRCLGCSTRPAMLLAAAPALILRGRGLLALLMDDSAFCMRPPAPPTAGEDSAWNRMSPRDALAPSPRTRGEGRGEGLLLDLFPADDARSSSSAAPSPLTPTLSRRTG